LLEDSEHGGEDVALEPLAVQAVLSKPPVEFDLVLELPAPSMAK
jgi:hypothetical protein